MGIVDIHPAFCVRAASKGLRGYGTWKSAQGTDLKEPILVTIHGSFRRSVTVVVKGRGNLNAEFAVDTEMKRRGNRSRMQRRKHTEA